MSRVRTIKPRLLTAVLAIISVQANQSQRSEDPVPLETVVQQLSANYDALSARFDVLSTSHDALLTSYNTLSTTCDAALAKVTSQQTRIEQLEEKNQRHVAFSAFIQIRHEVNGSNDAIIQFHSVITNVGNGFNPHTSVFTAPYNGDYFFSIYVDVSADYERVSLRKNDVSMVYADSDDTVSTRRSVSAVLSLTAGDVVTVNQEQDSGQLDEGRECVFSGFLIQ